VFVYHQASRSLHVDDTIMYFDETAGFLLYSIIFRIMQRRPGSVSLHTSAFSDAADEGLFNTEDATQQFTAWLEKICNEWDFDCLCTAHRGILPEGAKQATRDMLLKVQPAFKNYSAKHKGKH
jgi:hypothetical protein